MTILILILIYALSAFGMWKFLQIAHSAGGRWSNVSPNGVDVFVVFCPVFNTVCCFWGLFSGVRRSDENKYIKFFKIKK